MKLIEKTYRIEYSIKSAPGGDTLLPFWHVLDVDVSGGTSSVGGPCRWKKYMEIPERYRHGDDLKGDVPPYLMADVPNKGVKNGRY